MTTSPRNTTVPTIDDGTPAPLIRIRGLRKRYRATTALDGLDLDLAPGRIVGLLGENGCGKTTLMKVLAGVIADYEGEVRIDGLAPGPETKAITAFLPDRSFLADGWRIDYCLDLFADFFADFDRAKALELIGFFGLDPRMRLKEMSKGMREKVQVALVMSRRARVHLLDEPISGVDPAARQHILDGILRNLDEDSLLVVATHLIHDLEPILDSIVLMRHGRVMLAGDADELRAEHGLSLDRLFQEIHR